MAQDNQSSDPHPPNSEGETESKRRHETPEKPASESGPSPQIRLIPSAGFRQVAWTGLIVAVIATGLFWYHAAPTVFFHDSGEFALAAASAGIPHPPGAPTWVILASGFVRLLGFHEDPARGTNLFCGLCGGLTMGLLSVLSPLCALDRQPALSRRGLLLAGGIPPLALLHSRAFLEQSTTTEQYTLLTALLAALLIVLALQWLIREARIVIPPAQTGPVRLGLWSLAGLIWGLAIGNHLSQVCLALLLALALWACADRPHRVHSFLRGSLYLFLGLMAGSSVFLWVLWRSKADPAIDFGNIESFDRLVWALTRMEWQKRPITEAPAGFIPEWIASYDFAGQLGWIGAALAIAGIVILLRRQCHVLVGALAYGAPYAAGLLLGHLQQAGINVDYIRQYGVTDWHLPLYLLGALVAGLGTLKLVELLPVGRPRLGIQTGLILALLASSGMQIHQHSLRHSTAAQNYLAAILAPVPDDAILLVRQDNLAFMLGYELLGRPTISHRWIAVDAYSVIGAIARELAAGETWDADAQARYLQGPLIRPETQPFRVPPLTTERARRGPVVTTFDPGSPLAARYLVPLGLLFEVKLQPSTDEEILALASEQHRQHPALWQAPNPQAHEMEREAWTLLHYQCGNFFAARELWPQAVEAYDLAARWAVNNGRLWFSLGYALELSGQLDRARTSLLEAIHWSPDLPGPRTRLARIEKDAGNLDVAEHLLVEELQIVPDYPAALSLLDSVRQMHGNKP